MRWRQHPQWRRKDVDPFLHLPVCLQCLFNILTFETVGRFPWNVSLTMTITWAPNHGQLDPQNPAVRLMVVTAVGLTVEAFLSIAGKLIQWKECAASRRWGCKGLLFDFQAAQQSPKVAHENRREEKQLQNGIHRVELNSCPKVQFSYVVD